MSDTYFDSQPTPDDIVSRQNELGAWFEIDLDAITENLDSIRGRVGPQVEIMPVVKNDAYGHGLQPIVATLAGAGIRWLMVARTAEAEAIRRWGYDIGVMNMDVLYGDAQYRRVVSQNISQMIYTMDAARRLSDAAVGLDRPAGVFVKVDTGLRRVGVPHDEAAAFVESVSNMPGLEMRGMFSTFMLNDEQDADVLQRFQSIIAALKNKGISPGLCSLAASHGIFHRPDAWLDMVRPAMSLMGVYLDEKDRRAGVMLRQALSFKARIELLKWVEAGDSVTYYGRYIAPRRMRVATVHVGFYDALPRELSNAGRIRVAGEIRPVIGSVSLNHCLFDATDLDLSEGDVVELYSRSGENDIAGVARTAGWMPYSLLNHLNPFIPRIYYRGNAPVAILERDV